ncbi:MAG: response regulator transcription factor [Anaerolineales bacterium]|jgi:two-component system OmpR family response regulator
MITNSLNVVIIEDEPDTAEMYAEMLRLSGYNVVKYFGGLAAVAQILDQKPAAVVLDLMMPDLSGLEVLNYIKSQQDLTKIPVIIVSAKTLPEDIEAGLKAGATAYLTKPVSYSKLKTAIDDAISGSINDDGEN